jgi:poly(3-hydroxybutyrate) depolymerase
MTTRRWVLHALALCGLVSAALLRPVPGHADHDDLASAPVERLDPYTSIDPNSVTVSGLSSGGFFAHQFHIAYSKLVGGAGVVAGGPYGCVETIRLPFWWGGAPVPAGTAAVSVCSHYPGFPALPVSPSAQDSFDLVQKAFREGIADDPANLRDDRVWLFRGARDEVVPAATMQALADLYAALGVPAGQLMFRPNDPSKERQASHGIPVRKFQDAAGKPAVPCEEHAPPYVIECDGYEAAELLLGHLYGPGFRNTPEDPHAKGRLKAFDQRPFFDSRDVRAGLSDIGFLYVPAACENGSPASPARCRLHVAFHGCRQSFASIGDDFVRDAAYNRWAAANGIVVLYPQVKAWAWDPPNPLDPFNILANPQGCWDFWGYSGLGYRGRNGTQMQAVKAMVDRMLPRN